MSDEQTQREEEEPPYEGSGAAWLIGVPSVALLVWGGFMLFPFMDQWLSAQNRGDGEVNLYTHVAIGASGILMAGGACGLGIAICISHLHAIRKGMAVDR